MTTLHYYMYRQRKNIDQKLIKLIHLNKVHVVHCTFKISETEEGLCNINNAQATLVFQ